jgi:iron complex transport system ATP-binding protein
VLSSLSFELEAGLHFLAGANGSGKSSLLLALAGLLPYEGSIRLAGEPLKGLAPQARARRISLVPQARPSALSFSVREFVLMGRHPHRLLLASYGLEDQRRCEEALALMGIAPLAGRRLSQLSGGELQKAALAQALCQDTPVILLDEPEQSLDPRGRRELYGLLDALALQGKCILCATHDLDALRRPAARALGLRSGRLVFDQPGGACADAQLSFLYEDQDAPALS